MANIFDRFREAVSGFGRPSAPFVGPSAQPTQFVGPSVEDVPERSIPSEFIPEEEIVQPPDRQRDRPGLMGQHRWEAEKRAAPYQRGTEEYDEWLLSLPPAPFFEVPGGAIPDPEYNAALYREQKAAALRKRYREENYQDQWFRLGETIREEEKRLGPQPARLQVPDATGEGTEFRPEATVYGPDGEPIPSQFVMTRDGAIVPYEAELAAELEAGQLVGAQALMSGEYVWLGDEVGTRKDGPFERATVSAAYMHAEHASLLPYHWSPEQVTYAQEAMGLEPTGFIDQSTMQRWQQIVATAAGYTQAGRRVDPMTILDWHHNATEASRRGGGGGGGGGRGGFAVDLSQAQAVLATAMLEQAGREPNNDEISAFRAALQSTGGDVDPNQFAINWVRNHIGDEAGAYQAAADYYTAMMQILGGQTEAREGPM